MIKSVLRSITPPVIWELAKKALLRPSPPPEAPEPLLFDGDDELFLEIAADAAVYGEYGMGLSTRWVAQNTSATIHSVDSSQAWVDITSAAIGQSDRFHLQWVDVGPIGDWGMPEGYSRRDAFRTYLKAPWTAPTPPEVVLIDARFRVACWFESMLQAQPGTRIIFDDYTDRKHYHVVEEFLKPERFNARQALFVRPDTVDKAKLTRMRDAFLMVRD